MNSAIRRMAIRRSLDNNESNKDYYDGRRRNSMGRYTDRGYDMRGYDGQRGGNRRSGGRSRRDGNYDEEEYEMMPDGRRGVKGSGRGRSSSRRSDRGYEGGDRGSMPFGVMGAIVYDDEYCEPEYEYDKDYGRRDYGYDYRGGDDYNYGYDRNYDYRSGNYDYGRYDYGEDEMKLSKRDMQEWKQKMINADGTKGEHFSMERIIPLAQQLGIRFDEYSPKEFCMVVNMLYSDNANVSKKYITPDKELMYYVESAKAWLEDEDAPEGSEKLALYYDNIVNADD